MTTAAPPCAPGDGGHRAIPAGETPESAGQLGLGPAYPLCVQGDWRGGAAPPFEPPATATARAAFGRGALPPGTPGTVRPWLSAAPCESTSA